MDLDEIPKDDLDKKYCPYCFSRYDKLDEHCPVDGVLLRELQSDPLIGKTFAERYEIISVLGIGGMSIVYLGRHKLMGRMVAIKMLHYILREDIRTLERFRLEAQAASSLSHPNIVSVFDFGVTDQGEPFLVMDYLEGESLAKLIARKGAVDYQRGVHFFRQICAGLDAAHQKGIVHRDLKPANIVLIRQPDQWEEVKILDFGIAKLAPSIGRALHLTKAGEAFGSPLYMSPEQCLGGAQDHRSDIYSLGCLMYEVLAGVAPFDSPTVLEILNLHVSGVHLPLSELADEGKIPLELCEITEKCMAKEPAKRYQSCTEILKDLACIENLPVPQGSSWGLIGRPLDVLGRARFRKKLRFGKVALVLLVLVFSLLGFSFFSLWTGPKEDLGTAMSKLYWQLCLAAGDFSFRKGDYQRAEQLFVEGERIAKKFGDREHRLEVTLLLQADLYNRWEGHAEQLEKVNIELEQLYLRLLLLDYQVRMSLLEELDSKSSTSVMNTDKGLRSVAQIPGLLACSSKLLGKAFNRQAEKLLRKGVFVVEKLRPLDSNSRAQLELMLGIALYQSRKLSQARPHFLKAVELLKQTRDKEPRSYAMALSKLGEVELSLVNFLPMKLQELKLHCLRRLHLRVKVEMKI